MTTIKDPNDDDPNGDITFDYEKDDKRGKIPTPFINTQTIVVQICGRLGKGKTWSLVSETISACKALGLRRIISNVLFVKPIPGIEVIYTTDIREVFKRLSPSIPTALAFDELSKSVNSRLAKSTLNVVLSRLLGDLRKSGVRFFAYTHQARKESDTLVRSNNSHIMIPTHTLDSDGYPLYYVWNDNEKFEMDFPHGEEKYQYAVLMPSTHKLAQIDPLYDTFQKIPMQINPGLTEEEVPGAIDEFLGFCKEKGIELEGQKDSIVKIYLRRWNDNDKTHDVPYTPKALEIMFSEIKVRGLSDGRREQEAVPVRVVSLPSGPTLCDCGAMIEAMSKPKHMLSKRHREGVAKNNPPQAEPAPVSKVRKRKSKPIPSLDAPTLDSTLDSGKSESPVEDSSVDVKRPE